VAGLTNTVIGTGVENGVAYLDVRVSGTPAVSTFYNLVPDILVAGTSGQTWAGSFWGKFIAGSLTNTVPAIEIRESDAAQGFLTNTTAGISLSSTLTRFSLVRTLTNASTAFVSVRFIWQVTNGLPVDFTFRIGFPQLEQGAFATSVIPTTTAAATRTADVATMVGDNFSNWYNQTEGSFYVDARTNITYTVSNQFPYIFQVDDGTSTNRFHVVTRVLAPYTDSTYVVSVGGVSQVNFDTNESDGLLPKANAYKVNDFAFAVSGELETTDTSGLLPAVNRLCLGSQAAVTNYLNGHIRRIAYYPRRLPDDQLRGITV
jgi:hypothetical protein